MELDLGAFFTFVAFFFLGAAAGSDSGETAAGLRLRGGWDGDGLIDAVVVVVVVVMG